MMSKLKVSLLSGAAAAATLALGASSAFATNGMMPHCIGTNACGMGGAGVAFATDATNAATNPALGAKIGNEVMINLGAFRANVKGQVRDDNNTTATSGSNATGNEQTSTAKDFATGSLGINYVVDDTYSFNLTFFPGGGGASSWDDPRLKKAFNGGDHKVRYRMFYLQPSVSIKVSDTSSYGIGVILSRSDFKGDAAGRNYGSATTVNKAEVANGVGFQFGGLWQIADDASLGLNYRSPVFHEEFTNYGINFLGAINSPQQLTGGIAVENAGTDGLTVAVDTKWINWGGIDSIGGREPSAGGFGWQDQFVFMAGLEYDLGDNVAVRAGYNYGNSPIDETHVFANFLFPAVVEHHYTAGASVGVSDGIEVGMSAFYAPVNEVTDVGTSNEGYSWIGKGTTLSMGQYGGQVSLKVAF